MDEAFGPAGQQRFIHQQATHAQQALSRHLQREYVAIALFPLALATMQDLPGRACNLEHSSGLAMAAFVLLLMEFLLAGRGRRLSRALGMDTTMRVHQFAGIAALVLLYGPMYSESQLWDPLRNQSVVLTNASMVSGLLGLILLGSLAVCSCARWYAPGREIKRRITRPYLLRFHARCICESQSKR